MKRNLLEKGFIVVLFILVQVIFSFADRDSRKLKELYDSKSNASIKKQKEPVGPLAQQSPIIQVKFSAY
ncbi:MAG: hypothetical protein ACJ749_09000 [Flavisolibacter sp.]